MLKLDRALDNLKKPGYKGEVITGLPCDLCDKQHTKVIATTVEDFLCWEIHSPCLDRLARLAVKRIG